MSDPRVLAIGPIMDEPALAFDIGEGKLLFLQGEWLYEEQTYNAPPRVGDPCDEFLNGLPPPHAFPSTAFTVTRLPHSGEVLAIEVQGEYLPYPKTVHALRAEYRFRNSEIFEGGLEQVRQAMAEEHRRRQAGH